VDLNGIDIQKQKVCFPQIAPGDVFIDEEAELLIIRYNQNEVLCYFKEFFIDSPKNR